MILRKKYFLFILAFAICLPKISSGAYEETAYSLAGYRIGFSNAKGKETIFDVDKMGRITKITNPISHETAFSYDLSGNLATKTNALEEVTGYSYDSMNRVTNIVHESEEKADFEYNLAGNLTSKNTKSTKNVFVYDSMGRIIQSSNSVLSVSSVVNYTYDLNGNRTSLTVGDLSVDYSYNSENLTTNLAFSVSSVSSVVNYSYDDALRLSTISYDNGVNGAFDYDAENRVTGFTYKTNNTAFIDHTIIRNEQGFKTHQLIDAGLIPLLPANQRKISTYNDFDQLTSEQIQTDSGWIDTDYTWNANGCLTTVENEQTYDYDYNNRLVETTKGADSAEYLYDASGARVARIFTDSTSSTTNFFIIDYTDSLKRPLAETDADGNIIRYYIWNGFMLLAHIDIIENQNPSVVYYHQDELGNTLALTNSDGEVTDQFAYMPYGTTRHQPTAFSTFNIHNSAFLWLGGYGVFYEPELDIHLTVHRAYSANLRRFISPDPLGIDAFPNLYAYANMNPLAFIDPWGLCAELSVWGGFWSGFGEGFQGGSVDLYAQVTGKTPDQETQWITGMGAIITDAYVVGIRATSINELRNGNLGSDVEIAVLKGSYGGLLGNPNAHFGSTVNGDWLSASAGGGLHGVGIKAKAHAGVLEIAVHPQVTFPVPGTDKRLNIQLTAGAQAIAVGGDLKASLTRGVRIKASALFGLDAGVEWKLDNKR